MNKPMDFSITESLFDIISDAVLQLSFEKLPLVEFCCDIEEE